MRPGARLAAAVTVLNEVVERHRPAAQALADWARASRFAGSSDRSAVGNLVYDALRKRGSIAARMGSEAPRALVLGAAGDALGMTSEEVAAAADGSRHALAPLSAAERAALTAPMPEGAEPAARADLPAWALPSLTRALGDRLEQEGRALASRAPVDVRVNTLKVSRETVLADLSRLGGVPTPLSPVGIRFPPPHGAARQPNVEAEPAHGMGHIEIQDEGSQIAALLVGAAPGMQVLDLCAGAGGKALAMAAQMGNSGRILAHDADKVRLRPIFERLVRAGATCIEVLAASDGARLDTMEGSFDRVLVDAPCTGSGTWRRRPDTKWRLKRESIAKRQAEQAALLDRAARLTRPGGRLVYVTCSLFPEENGDQVEAFLARQGRFRLVPFAIAWRESLTSPPPASADGQDGTLLLSPARHGTDGFFVAILERA